MTKPVVNALKLAFVWIGMLLCLFKTTKAQVPTIDSAGLKLIKISHTDSIRKYEGKLYMSFLGAVVIEHDGIVMNCDSAHLFSEKNFVEAFGNVHLQKANGSSAHADYIKYTGNNNTAFMQGQVQIIDGNNTLSTEELTYNVKTKIGKYYKWGQLTNEETQVSSETGTYNGFSQQSYFKNNVVINNPEYNIESKELTYNMKTKVVRFLDESTIITEKSTIYTSGGTYDSKNTQAVFNTRTTVENEDQILIGNHITYNDKKGSGKAKGDVVIIDTKNDSKITCQQAEYNKLTGQGHASIDVRIENEGGQQILTCEQTQYNKKTGYAKATQKVVLIDTAQKSKLLCEVLELNEFSKFMLATVNPKLITKTDEDSLYLRADTLISMRIKDSSQLRWIKLKSVDTKAKEQYSFALLHVDSTYAQSDEEKEEPRWIISNHHVKLFADSMQAVCDSLVYSQSDSIFRMYKSPVMWSKNQQAHADTVWIHTVNNELSELNLKANALLVSETGYTGYYDQVSGQYIDAYFIANDIQRAHVDENAESLYYAKDEDQQYIGLNKSESASLNILFKEKEVNRITMYQNPKGLFIPIDQLTEAQKFLKSYQRFDARRPKNKAEILTDTPTSSSIR